ncbi:MAG: DUF2238 domain-containing protein [Candidatus Palauibacterales bacterium]|nr:DUF2238 domain-containing protein [Candidatus Palauibacterales bacterium]
MDRRLRPVAAFTFGYLAIALTAGLRAGNSEFLFYIGVMLVLIGVVAAVNRAVELTTGTLWALSLWGLAHMAGGLVVVPSGWPVNAESRVLYSLWLIPGRLKYDQVVHAYGFGVTTWVCWQGLKSAVRKKSGRAPSPTFGLLALAAAAGLGFGALNEVVEFVATLTMPETNVGGYVNTGWDLVSNTVGALTAIVLIRLRDRGTASARR